VSDYHTLIARAVEGLDKSSGKARRALYKQARTALVTQLCAIEPSLSESEITKERLALEDAIRKVEADAARKSRAELLEQQLWRDSARVEPRRIEPISRKPGPATAAEVEAPRPGQRPTAREQLLGARSSPSTSREGVKDFRGVVGEVNALGSATAKAGQSARATRDSYGPASSQPYPPADHTTSFSDYGPMGGEEDLNAAHYQTRHSRSREPPYDLDDDPEGLHPALQPPHAADDEHRPLRPPRWYYWLATLLVALIIFGGLLATISWQWPRISGTYHYIAQIGSRQPSQTSRETTSQPKFSERVPQKQSSAQGPAAGAPGSQTGPEMAQHVVLYEEDSNDPQGKRYVGSVIWRTKTVSPGPGLAPELAVRADVAIPEQGIIMTWSLRRNADQNLPASHIVEITFNLTAVFRGGGIASVPGILMKQSEQAPGTPLAKAAVKVTNGLFMIELSADNTDVKRNIQLLKKSPWFDIPIVYTNGSRAILAMEKGPPGERAFAEAFAAWESN
jgi:hypothetical protein